MAAFPIPVVHVGQGADMLNIIRSGQARHPFIPGAGFLWRCPIGHADLTAAATSQTIALNTLQAADPFPVDVIRGQAFAVLDERFSGGSVSDATMILGDAGDDNGLIVITDGLIFTGDPLGVLQSPSAAEFAHRVEPSFGPQAIIAATGDNVVNFAAGLVTVCIFYMPLRGLEV
jgi:hypothetical protein